VFDSDFLKKLEYLSLVSKRVFRGQLLAQRRTRQLGGGVEFADHRDYTSGDDLRYLDWNVFARFGQELIKRFEEEEDLHVYFLLDCSKSMNYGSPNKFDYARQITAALAYIALADLDRVSILAFADGVREIFPLTRGKQCILSLLRFLENLEVVGEDTNMERSASDFIHRRGRTGLAVVVSDLFDPNGFERGIDLLRHQRFEPHLVQVHCKTEAKPHMLGDLELLDAETNDIRNVTISEAMLRRYRNVFEEFLDSVSKYCTGKGLGCTIAKTEIPFDELILRMMRESGGVR